MDKDKKLEGAPLTLNEAADYLGLSTSFVYKLTASCRLTHYKPSGGRLYFLREDLDAYILRGRRAGDYELSAAADAHLAGRRV